MQLGLQYCRPSTFARAPSLSIHNAAPLSNDEPFRKLLPAPAMSPDTPRFQMVTPAGFTPVVGSLASALIHSRASVIDSVKDMTVSQLDHQHDDRANPVGALLAHIATVEWFYGVASIEGRQPAGNEWAERGVFMRLGAAAWAAAKGQTIEQHLERLARVREKTLAGLATKDDAWLEGTLVLPWTTELANHHWAWYHVVEDALNHRGQIRWLKARM